MIFDDFAHRYAAILRIVLREPCASFLEVAEEVGRELYSAGASSTDVLKVHERAVALLRASEADLLEPGREEKIKQLLETLLQGWQNECQSVQTRLRESLAAAENSLQMARRTARSRLRQLTRSNRLLLKEVFRRRKLEKRLQDVKTWLQRAQDLANLGFWILHIPEGMLEWHGLAKFLRRSGTEPQAIRSIEDFLAWVHPDDRQAVDSAFAEILGGKKPPQLEFRLRNDEVRYVRQDVALGWRRGKVTKALGVMMDITAVKQAEQATRQVERIAALGTLAAGIAHEINNPLGAAMLSAETALSLFRQAMSPESVEKCLQNIVASLDRCSRIVTAILRFSRHQPGTRESCDLNAVISRCCEMVHPFLEQRQATLSFSPANGLLPIQACVLELELAFTNLLRNAIESRPSGVRVRVKAAPKGHLAEVDIVDNGRGMTSQEANRMFDPFFTRRSSEGGTGLGASLAFLIIQDHGGHVEVDSSPGEGTTVRVFLPLEQNSAELGQRGEIAV
ncbi:Sensor histidine kinase [Thermogutta terrifontis]|uniref:histidine kinase n=1 Tax=Thermogutta terrifontis TaxID=1331910 RepID=A0A286RC75_9BACT|nr:PAS domain-containing sensor histidine kinase [Thermogutta terrifontis]ASV73563.1 Sensor histidine kinase [Thermogutta terrifontis]